MKNWTTFSKRAGLWAAVLSLLGGAIGSSLFANAARNAGGTYTLPNPAGSGSNPVVSGTTIASSWANVTLGDLAAEMSDSLDRSGKGAMLAHLQLFDGTVVAPGLTFGSDTASGLYRIGANDYGFSIGGVKQEEWTTSAVTLVQGSLLSPTATAMAVDCGGGTCAASLGAANATTTTVGRSGQTTNLNGTITASGATGASAPTLTVTGNANGNDSNNATGLDVIGGASTTNGQYAGSFEGAASGTATINGEGGITTTGGVGNTTGAGGRGITGLGGLGGATSGAGGKGGFFTGGQGGAPNGAAGPGAQLFGGAGTGTGAGGDGVQGTGGTAPGSGAGGNGGTFTGATSSSGTAGFGVSGTGAGTSAGGTFANGTAATGGTRQDALVLSNGDIKLDGVANPTSTTALKNRLTPANIVKAWVNLTGNGASPTINAAFNITSATCASQVITVTMAQAMSSGNYVTACSTESAIIVFATHLSSSQFVLHADTTTPTIIDLCANTPVIDCIVLGAQ